MTVLLFKLCDGVYGVKKSILIVIMWTLLSKAMYIRVDPTQAGENNLNKA